ncbi:MAG: discoidin domain-containing protein, partial [Candidatus Aminicenantales bacterium]
QWIQVDLGASHPLHAILLWHFHSQARVYRDVVVKVSDDPTFKTGVTAVYNNDHDNTSKLGAGKDKEYIETFDGKLFDPKGVKARYVRLYSGGNTSNDMNHYVEVEVYGLPAK